MAPRYKASVLQIGALQTFAQEMLAARFNVTGFADEAGALAAVGRLGGMRGIATSGKAAIGGKLIQALPDLRIISCLGAGTDGIDVNAARAGGITVATTSRVLTEDVADIAIGLIIATSRDFVGADRFVRAGAWGEGRYRLGRSLGGAKLGIVGLGNIGRAVARRAAAFDMQIAYTARHPVENAPYAYMASPAELARWSRFLVLCCPGGPGTLRLVDRDVLAALGPDGILINVSRGSVVDEAALAEALENHIIAGAGLDVFENEPTPHAGLICNPRVTLLPHIGSATEETRQRMAESMVEALAAVLEEG